MIKLTVDQYDKDEDISVIKLNSVSQTYPMHTHDFFEVFLVTKGRAMHCVNNEVQIVERGSFVFIRPTDEHCYDYYKTDDFEFFNIGFTKDNFEDANTFYFGQATSLIKSKLPKHIKLDEEKLCYFERRLNEYKNISSKAERRLLLSLIISYSIYLHLTIEESNADHRPPDWIITVIDEMSKQENFIIGLPRLLELSNYSQEHINREFKRYLKTTPTKYINELRLKYANQLLTTTNMEIVEVCGACGFNNLSHFYVEFKKLYGLSPNKSKLVN